MASLGEYETIDGEHLRELIAAFEVEMNMESKLQHPVQNQAKLNKDVIE